MSVSNRFKVNSVRIRHVCQCSPRTVCKVIAIVASNLTAHCKWLIIALLRLITAYYGLLRLVTAIYGFTNCIIIIYIAKLYCLAVSAVSVGSCRVPLPRIRGPRVPRTAVPRHNTALSHRNPTEKHRSVYWFRYLFTLQSFSQVLVACGAFERAPRLAALCYSCYHRHW